jgi:hypothetical protein
MRGLAQPTGAMLPNPLQSNPKIEKRLPHDKARRASSSPRPGFRTAST